MSKTGKLKHMKNSTEDYIERIFENASKLTAVRVDLSYTKEHANQCSLKDLNQDLSHLQSLRRSNKTVFRDMVGFVIKREYTEDKGPHAHALFLFNGQKVQKDAYKGDQLGELWQDVTDNKGIYYNCNRNKENYARSGLGLIDHTDTEKRESLNLAVDYLCKSEQSIDPLKETGKERSFTRGVAPRPKSNAGRPRHEIEGEAPETDEN